MTLTKIAKRRLTEVPIGTILPHYDFNGILTFDTLIYKFCDGSIVSDAESPLYGLYVPDMSNRYLVGFGSSQVDEVQLLTTNHPPTGGTFTITFDGQTTTAIAWNDSDVASTAAFVALSTVGVGNAAVAKIGNNWRITFTGNLGGRNVNAVTATSSLTWASPGIVTLTITTPTPGAGCDVGTAVWDASPVGNAGHQAALVNHGHALTGSSQAETTHHVHSLSAHTHTAGSYAALLDADYVDVGGELCLISRVSTDSWESTHYISDAESDDTYIKGGLVYGVEVAGDSGTPSSTNTGIESVHHSHGVGTYVVASTVSATQGIQPRSLRIRWIIRIK